MKKLTRLWIYLALGVGGSAHAADVARIDVSGKLVTPACSPSFVTSLEVKLKDANVRQLLDDSAAVTEVPLTFTCRQDSRVTLLLTPGLGGVDSQTLRTSREGLGLRLVNVGSEPGFSLGEASDWAVGSQPLVLTLRVKPVLLGAAPEVGTFTTTLLMQIVYL